MAFPSYVQISFVAVCLPLYPIILGMYPHQLGMSLLLLPVVCVDPPVVPPVLFVESEPEDACCSSILQTP